MKFTFKTFAVWLIISCCAPLMGVCQTTSNIIDTAAKAQVFAPGVVSSPYTEWATSFSNDGNTVYFSRGAIYWTICFAKKVNGEWANPQVAAFSGKWNDTDPFVSPDGKKLFFVSNRPLENAPQTQGNKNYHLWYVDHISGDQWGTPHHIDAEVNKDAVNDYAPSVSSNGTLFWCSRDRDGTKGMQSFYAGWLGDHFDTPRQVIVKGAKEIQDPFIGPNEKYLVFLDGNDICISFRNGSDWTDAQKLPKQINSGEDCSSPCISPDGKMLYFSSSRSRGFYKRDIKNAPLNIDELNKENENIFNSNGNIFMIPINLPQS